MGGRSKEHQGGPILQITLLRATVPIPHVHPHIHVYYVTQQRRLLGKVEHFGSQLSIKD